MRRGALLVGMIVLGIVLMGGRTLHPKGKQVHYVLPLDAASITLSEAHIAVCYGNQTKVEQTVASTTQSFCYTRPGRDLVLTRFGIIVTEPLTTASDENCQLALEVSDDGTVIAGSDLASSVIQVGEGNVDAVNCDKAAPSNVLDAPGEFCMVDLTDSLADRTVDAGGWWSVHVENGTLGTCAELTGLNIVVWGIES